MPWLWLSNLNIAAPKITCSGGGGGGAGKGLVLAPVPTMLLGVGVHGGIPKGKG